MTLDVTQIGSPQELFLGLSDPRVLGAGVTGVTLDVSADGTTLLHQTFASAAAAQAYFTNHRLDLGSLAGPDLFSDTLGLAIVLNVTSTSQGSGFFADFMLGQASADPLGVTGTASADILHGWLGNDVIVTGAGSDAAFGGAGDDGVFFGPNFDPSDFADGGEGFDQLGLQGNYAGGLAVAAGSLANIEQLVLLPGNDTRFGDTAGNFYSYDLTTGDANVGAGERMVVTFNTLRDGENVTFDGSAESDGWFLTYGGHGDDRLTGGSQSDGFFFGHGLWGVGDRVDGHGGVLDELGLQGHYTASGAGAVVFGADQLTGILIVVCLSGGDTRFGSGGLPYSYDLTTNDGNVLAGQTLYFSANALAADESLTLDGSAETDGSLVVFSGAGDDDLTGGAGADKFYGAAGADRMAGGGGYDTFSYVDAAHSTAVAMDQILDFADGDRIDLSTIDPLAGGGDDAFSFIGAATFSNAAGQLRAFEQSAGHWQVEGDIDGDSTADLVIAVATDHALTGADFVL
jgi:Ca2+-binding RTX toxin-like protein